MAFSQYISNVTDGIVDGVRKLEDLGVGAVLVNLLPPLGCAPLNTRADNVLVLLWACLGPCTRGLNIAASYLAPRPLLALLHRTHNC